MRATKHYGHRKQQNTRRDVICQFQLSRYSAPRVLGRGIDTLSCATQRRSALSAPQTVRHCFGRLSRLHNPSTISGRNVLSTFLQNVQNYRLPFTRITRRFHLVRGATHAICLPINRNTTLYRRLHDNRIAQALLQGLNICDISYCGSRFSGLSTTKTLRLQPSNSTVLASADYCDRGANLTVSIRANVNLCFWGGRIITVTGVRLDLGVRLRPREEQY